MAAVIHQAVEYKNQKVWASKCGASGDAVAWTSKVTCPDCLESYGLNYVADEWPLPEVPENRSHLAGADELPVSDSPGADEDVQHENDRESVMGMNYEGPPSVWWDDETKGIRLYCHLRLQDRCLRIPGLKAAVDRNGVDYWRARPSWTTIVAIGAEFADIGLQVDPELDTVVDWHTTREKYAEWLKAGGTPVGEVFEPHLRPYQQTGVLFLTEMETAMLTDEMGTGKTVMALGALVRVDSSPALVVCPTSMTHEWAAEASRFAPQYNSYVLSGSKAAKTKLIAAAAEDPAALVIINWSGLRTVTKLQWYGSAKPLTAEEKSDGPLQSIDFLTVIADEVHRAKDPGSKQSMALKYVSRNSRWKWGLTGTPLANHPGDLWSPLNWLDPDEWSSKREYIERWVFQVETAHGMKPVNWLPHVRPEIDRLISKYILRRTKAEVLPDLPEKTYQTRYVELAGKQKTHYNQMKKDMLVEVDGEVAVATEPLVQLGRLSQLASATPIIEGGEITGLDKPSVKVEALFEILAELGEDRSVVVFAESRKLLELVAQELDKGSPKHGVPKQSYIEINGTVPPELRSAGIATFQAGNARVALVTLGAGAEGITLTRADTAVFLQRSYSMVKNLQAEDRIHRIGQDSNKVQIIDIVAKGTVDVAVAAAARRKEELLIDTLKDVERIAKGES